MGSRNLLMDTGGTKTAAHGIEYALFAADATRADVEKCCADARAAGVVGVCVNGSRVELTRTLLEETEIQTVALVGFPLGAADSDAKRYETEIAVDHGAQEIDFVLNHGKLKDGDTRHVLREMRDIAEAADERPVKVVFEGGLLNRDEQILVCKLALDSGASFVCIGTGFAGAEIAAEDARRIREAVGNELKIKAAGRVRDSKHILELAESGISRIGISARVNLHQLLQH